MKTTPLHFAIALLALTVGARCSTESGGLTGGEEPTPTTGTISVAVMSGGGSPVSATATVRLTGPAERSTTGAVGATLTFTDLPPGTYTVTVTVSSFIGCDRVNANVGVGETTTVNITCSRQVGTITGTVSGSGMPIRGATVRLSSPTSNPIKTTGPDGSFTFVAVVGENTLTTFHQGFVCPVRTVLVELHQTATAEISCTPKTTGSIAGRVVGGIDDGFGIPALVVLTGPANRTATTNDNSFGSFRFDDLAPGTYTLAATTRGRDCPAVSVDVQAAQTTELFIRCTHRPPIGSEIEGDWDFTRVLDSQTGSCPSPLPMTGIGSTTFNPSNNTVSIVGLDPELTIVGTYDKDSGLYTGSGSTVLGDGSSVQTDMTASFSYVVWEDAIRFDAGFTPSWTRHHRNPGSNLVCTEIYGASGWRVDQ